MIFASLIPVPREICSRPKLSGYGQKWKAYSRRACWAEVKAVRRRLGLLSDDGGVESLLPQLWQGEEFRDESKRNEMKYKI